MQFKLLTLLVFGFVFLVLPIYSFADQDFDITTEAKYQVFESGTTRITQVISIQNKTDFIYTPTYSVGIGFKDIKNLKTFNSAGSIQDKVSDSEDGKNIELTFPEKVVGKGKINEFTISFESSEIAKKKGNIWEINIPGLSSPESFLYYDSTLIVPESFGKPSVIKPYNKFESNIYKFSKNDVGRSGIFLLFGDSQFYNLELTYTISNPKIIPIKTEIALPPATSYQDVRIDSIKPLPLDVYEDPDGNWLAVYNLNPKELKTIKVQLKARVFASPVFDLFSGTGEPGKNLSASKYWEVNDKEIKALAREYKTPEEIYDFVVGKLSYNYDKVSENNIRLGAKEALRRPDYAVCLEFTDLFVAIARAAGIKSRSVEGYAVTENSKLRPLSLVADILHSWPEYFDKESKTWRMVDPTWGNTTHGMDYFNSLDFSHITFVKKGESSTYPIPAGGYKINESSQDIKVSIASVEDFSDHKKEEIKIVFPKNILSGLPVSGSIIISNLGNSVVKNKKLYIQSDLGKSSQEILIDKILPYSSKVIPVEFPKTQFLTNKTYTIKISFAGTSQTQLIEVGIFPDFYWIIFGGVLIIGSFIVSIVTYKTWRIYLQKRFRRDNLHRESKRP